MTLPDMIKKLRLDIRIIGTIVILSAFVISINAWYTISTERLILSNQIEALGNSLLLATSIASVEALVEEDYPVLETIAEKLTQDKNDVGYVRIRRVDGKVVAESTVTNLSEENIRVFVKQVKVYPEAPQSIGEVEIGILTRWSNELITNRIKVLSIGLLTSFIVLTLTLSLLLKHFLTDRILLLYKDIKTLGRRDLDHPISISGNDELSQLGAEIDDMRKRIKAFYHEIQLERDKLTTIILATREGIISTDRKDNIVLINPAAERLLEKTRDQIIEDGFHQLMDNPDYLNFFLEDVNDSSPELILPYKNRILSLYASTIKTENDGKIGSAALIRDVSTEKELEAQLIKISTTDALTGLSNRRDMDKILETELSRTLRYGTALSLIMIDVDHFKKFNDLHGHEMGDTVLRSLAETMKQHCRNIDYPCRYGGEEFCIILPGTNTLGALESAERLRKKIENTPVSNLRITISVGVASVPDIPSKKPNDLLNAADKALYEAKNQGRNCVRVTQNKDTA